MENKKHTVCRRIFSLLLTTTIIFSALLCCGVTASAAGITDAAGNGNVQYFLSDGGVTGKLKELEDVLVTVGRAVAGVASVILAIVIIGGGGQGLQKGKGMAISICVGVILLGVAPTIVAEIGGTGGTT